MDLLAMVLVVAASFFWAIAQVISKKALSDTGVTLFNFIRLFSIIPFVALGVSLAGEWDKIPMNGYLIVGFMSGALGLFAAGLLFFYLMQKSTSHQVLPIGNSHLFWIILLSAILLNESITVFLLVGAVLIFSGSIFLISKDEATKSGRFEWKILLAILVAFMWGLVVVMNKYCLDGGFVASTLLFVEVGAGVLLFAPTLSIGGQFKIERNSWRNVGIGVASGILGLLIGEQLYLMSLQIEKASILAPFLALTVLFGFLLSIFILKERPAKKAIIGAVLIIIGLVVVTF